MTTPDTPARALDAETRNFHWAYSLLVALAVRCLEDANRTAEPGEWPNGMEWGDLNGSSRGVFLRLAREEAGIDHDEFLAYVRAGMGDEVQDIYERKHTAARAPASGGAHEEG